jgi:hypothetical protein
MVAGFHLALEAPSSVSVGLCLLHGVYDKTAWLERYPNGLNRLGDSRIG